MVTKRPHILKQTYSFRLQVCLSMCDLLLSQGIKGLNLSEITKKLAGCQIVLRRSRIEVCRISQGLLDIFHYHNTLS